MDTRGVCSDDESHARTTLSPYQLDQQSEPANHSWPSSVLAQSLPGKPDPLRQTVPFPSLPASVAAPTQSLFYARILLKFAPAGGATRHCGKAKAESQLPIRTRG